MSEEETTHVADPLLGKDVGDYRIEQRIGAGGMGVVYRGLHRLIGKPVAIKVLRFRMDQESTQRLLAEARTVASLRHRGITDIFGFGTSPDGRPYIVMELLQGKPLDVLLKEQGPMSADEVLWILEEALGPLAVAHTSGVIHRDLKPSNFFVSSEAGGARYLKILDFGLAKRRSSEQNLTAAGSILGTPEYLSPEQATAKPLTPAADLYSLGAMAFELLTGTPPFTGPSPIEIILKQLNAIPPRVSTKVQVPEKLDDLVAQLLEKDPANRPGSATELKSQVVKLRKGLARQATVQVAQPVLAPAPVERKEAELPRDTRELAAARPSNSRVPLYVGAAVLLLGVAGALAVYLQRDRAPAPVPALVEGAGARPVPRAPALAEPELDPPPHAPVDGGSAGVAVRDAPPAEPVADEAGLPEPAKKPRVPKALTVADKIKRAERELRAGARGREVDPLALGFLRSFEADLGRDPANAARVEKDLEAWRRRFLR